MVFPGTLMALSPRLFVAVWLALPWAVAQAQQAPALQAPVVQPGAPGQPSHPLTGDAIEPKLPPVSAADVSFMQGMIMHHNQAVVMTGLITSHHASADVQSIGEKISLSQTQEMAFMKQWLEARQQPLDMSMPGMADMDMSGAPMPSMPGMLTPAQMTALRNATGPQFDHLFLTGMIQHHTGALTMVDQLFKSPGAGQRRPTSSTSPPTWTIHSARRSASCKAFFRIRIRRNNEPPSRPRPSRRRHSLLRPLFVFPLRRCFAPRITPNPPLRRLCPPA